MKEKFILFFLFFFLQSLSAFAQDDPQKFPKGLTVKYPFQESKMVVIKPESIIFEENFETGATSWTKNGSWAIGTPTSGPNSGYNSSKCAATNLSGNYPINANDWLISSAINLGSLGTATQITLSFMEWFQTESSFDKGYVKISTNSGTSWTTLNSRDGSSNWKQSTADLTSYANKQIKIAFHFTSDGSTNYLGWYVDNVVISKNELEPLTANLTSLNAQNFPFIYMNVAVDTFGIGYPGLTLSNFKVYENNILQANYFNVVPPDVTGGVRLADIIFIMDNSGSMSEEQTSVRNNVINFVNDLVSSGVNFALGLCRYGSSTTNGDPIIEDNGILTSDANYFKNTVWARNNISGSREPGYYAIVQSTSRFSFRPGAQKIFIIITDETPNQGGATQSDALNALKNNSVTLFALTESGLYSDFTPLTTATSGKIFDIYSSFSEILTYIKTQVANSYVVSYKSSNPTFDGTTREVKVVVNYKSDSDTALSSYVPGSAPNIQRNAATIALHNQAWAEGTSFNIEAEITDNVTPYVSSATVYYRKTGTTNYSSIAMSKQTGNLYKGVIPGSSVRTPGLDYYITATDGSSTSSDPKVNPASNPYQIAILPNIAPIIMHTPVTTLTPGTVITITANIVDNTNSLAVTKLFYRKTGQLIYQELNMTSTGSNNYQGIIPASYVTNDGVDYYIFAADNFGVSNTHGSADSPHKIEPLYDLGFRPNPDGWRFSNSMANTWPQSWWNQFNYCNTYPYPLGWCLIATSSNFPDWPLFVDAFKQDVCYIDSPPGIVIYNPLAVLKWFGIKGSWGGSCFGFAISSFLFFDNLLSLSTVFPGNVNVYSVPIRDDSRRLINLYWIYQFGQNQLSHINANRLSKTPLATLNEIKQMFLSKVRDDKILVFFNQNGKGGHAVNPYRVGVGEIIDTVYIYDNNAPNTERKILINKVLNRWEYSNMPNWGGEKGLFLMDPASNYLTHPILPKDIPPRERHISNAGVDSIKCIEIYNSESDATIVSVIGDSIGYRRLSGMSFSTLSKGMPIVPITGGEYPPIGYYIPLGSYTMQLSNFADTTMYVYVLSDSSAISLERGATKPHQRDRIAFDMQATTLQLFNTDTSGKIYSMQSVVVEADTEKVFGINNCNILRGDTLGLYVEQRNNLKISNNGSNKNYDLLVKAISRSGEFVFEHRDIPLLRNSIHQVEPQWDRIADQKLKILIDINMDGIWDDTLRVDNQYTGGSPLTPGTLSNQNVYAYPNPFNPEFESAKFRFKLGKDGNVNITVYDISNNKVRELISNTSMSLGVEQSVLWDGRNERGDIVANGVYFYVIESSSGERAVGKIAVLR